MPGTETAEHSDGPRVALVGAASLLGAEIRQQLSDSGIPGSAVSLLDLDEVAGVLTEYGDEARVLAEAVEEDILAHDFVCFCGDPETASEHFEAVRREGRVGLDCTGASAARDDVFLWLPGVSPPPTLHDNSFTALPSAGTLLLAPIMNALGKPGARAAVTLLLPASERGEPGLRELSQQTIAVLNLEELDTSVFGRRLAFDAWPASHGEMAGADLTAAELDRLKLAVPAVSVVAVSVFHGIAASLFVPDTTPDDLGATLGEAGITVVEDADGGVDSPVLAAGGADLHVSGIRPDPGGGTWAWVVADNFGIRAGAAAVAIRSLLGPELSDAPQ